MTTTQQAFDAMREALEKVLNTVLTWNNSDDFLWMQYALPKLIAAAKAVESQETGDEYKRGFSDGMKEAPTGADWIRAIDEAMVGAHIGIADMADDYGAARKKLNDLICWSIQVDRDFNRAVESQPERQPLTDERVTDIYNEVCADWVNRYNRPLSFARAIEAAHGITNESGNNPHAKL